MAGKKRKKVPVEVDTKTRWGSTKAKEAESVTGRLVANKLAEMGLTDGSIDGWDTEMKARKAEVVALDAAHSFEVAQRKILVQKTEDNEREIRLLRDGLQQAVAVLDKITREMIESAAAGPTRATGTTPDHGMRIGLGCSCGVRFVDEDAMVQHLAEMRLKR